MADIVSSNVVRRHPGNPAPSADDDAPHRSTLVFNAGAAKFHSQYVRVLRNDCRDEARPPRVVGTNPARPTAATASTGRWPTNPDLNCTPTRSSGPTTPG